MKIIPEVFKKKINTYGDKLKIITEIRFIIVDDNDKIIDDCNGYGYKTIESANKVLTWKYNK